MLVQITLVLRKPAFDTCIYLINSQFMHVIYMGILGDSKANRDQTFLYHNTIISRILPAHRVEIRVSG